MGEHLQNDGMVAAVGVPEPPRLKSRMVALAVAAGMASVAVILLLGSHRQALLCRNLLPADAQRVSDALADAGVSYRLRENGSAIFVSRENLHTARLEVIKRIADHGLLRFDLVDFSATAISKATAQYVAALQAELEATLAAVDGVESARVLIEMPGNRGRINGDRPLAVVLLHTARSTKLTPAQVRVIQRLVASSTDLLTPDQVSISENAASLVSFEHKEL